MIFFIILLWLNLISLNLSSTRRYSILTDLEAEQPINSKIKRFYGKPNKQTGEIIKNLKTTDNPEEYGQYIEGDILIPINSKRTGIIDESKRWSKGIIPFEINGNFSENELLNINLAIEKYHEITCIKFTPYTNQTDYISIENSETGCWSSIGRIGGKQTVNLQSSGCLSKIGTIEHELMHAIGFNHEQNREDRDDYININWSNIQQNTKFNFQKVPIGTTTNYNISYAFDSIMHYSKNAFAINRNIDTIIPKVKDDVTQAMMGQRAGLAEKDIQRINRMYRCEESVN